MTSEAANLLRHRATVPVVACAVVALTATYILYTRDSTHRSAGLHRSNAIRRPRMRLAPSTRPPAVHETAPPQVVRDLVHQGGGEPLGPLEFFNERMHYDALDFYHTADLRALAGEIAPDAGPDRVDVEIAAFYRNYLNQLLNSLSNQGVLDDGLQTEMGAWLQETNPELAALLPEVIEATEAHSVAGTEIDLPADANNQPGHNQPGQPFQHLLYLIAEEQANLSGIVHRSITCDQCGVTPIRGVRWHCANCADYDICSNCEANPEGRHPQTHIFYKVPIPTRNFLPRVQPVAYPGSPEEQTGLDAELRSFLLERTGLPLERIQSLHRHFTFLAHRRLGGDPGWLIDRETFINMLVPRYAGFERGSNLVYDRAFAHFDRNRDGVIDVVDFIEAMAGLESSDDKVKSQIVFSGYDLDGDGYISRKDVLRLLEAHHELERDACRNHIEQTTAYLVNKADPEIASLKGPLSAEFWPSSTAVELNTEIPAGKVTNQQGDFMEHAPFGEDLDDAELGMDMTQNPFLGGGLHLLHIEKAMNELVNPLFHEKEGLALAVSLYPGIHNADISSPFTAESPDLALIARYGLFKYSAEILERTVHALNHRRFTALLQDRHLTMQECSKHIIRHFVEPCEDGVLENIRSTEADLTAASLLRDVTPTKLEMWNAGLARRFMRLEIADVLCSIFRMAGWIKEVNADADGLTRDPTMIQFRPNSEADRLVRDAQTPPPHEHMDDDCYFQKCRILHVEDVLQCTLHELIPGHVYAIHEHWRNGPPRMPSEHELKLNRSLNILEVESRGPGPYCLTCYHARIGKILRDDELVSYTKDMLVATNQETKERGAPALLDFDEFQNFKMGDRIIQERELRERRLRCLEAWLQWVTV